MRKASYIFLLMWCGNSTWGWGSISKEEQEFIDLFDNQQKVFDDQRNKFLASFKEKSAGLQKMETRIKELNERESQVNNELGTKMTKIKELDKEIKNKSSLKENILNDIEAAEKQNRSIQNENEKLGTEKSKLISEIEQMQTKSKELNGDNEMLTDKNKQLNTAIVTQEVKTKELTQEIETKSNLKKTMINDIALLNRQEEELQKGNIQIENEIVSKTKSHENIVELIEQAKIEKTDLDDSIQVNKNEETELKKGNKEMLKGKCKEHYTFWNFEFLSNNKESVFISFLTTVLISASLPFLFGMVTSTSSDISSSKQKIVQKQSSSRLEHMSDDEESNAMVPSSSVLLNRDIKYNYDREALEKNEDPNGCFDFIRRRYKIKENLKSHWQNLKHGKFVYLNLWKVENDELTLTKILLKKVLKADTPLLTFELFQTKLSDGSSYSDCVETELDEEDDRIEAKLAMKIFYKLPEFSV